MTLFMYKWLPPHTHLHTGNVLLPARGVALLSDVANSLLCVPKPRHGDSIDALGAEEDGDVVCFGHCLYEMLWGVCATRSVVKGDVQNRQSVFVSFVCPKYDIVMTGLHRECRTGLCKLGNFWVRCCVRKGWVATNTMVVRDVEFWDTHTSSHTENMCSATRSSVENDSMSCQRIYFSLTCVSASQPRHGDGLLALLQAPYSV